VVAQQLCSLSRGAVVMTHPLCSLRRHAVVVAQQLCSLSRGAVVCAVKLNAWILMPPMGAVVLILDMHAADALSDLAAARQTGNVISVGNTSMTPASQSPS
jgi:hypothetical protein